MTAAIALSGIGKAFSGHRVLDQVDLEIRPGEVLGLLGENGAGKSTLMNCCYGLLRPDAGSIAIAGSPVTLRSPRQARALGIGMVHQHFALVPTLGLDANLSLALGRGLWGRDSRALRGRIDALAANLGWTLRIDGPVGRASVGQQQRLEILKALAEASRVLILDEPTAVLAPQEVDELLPALRRLADQGRAVVLISHKLHEVTRCCDRIAVLRHGRLVHDGPVAAVDAAALTRAMVGADLPPAMPRPAQEAGETILACEGIDVSRDDGGEALRKVDLRLRRGRITAIAGVDGNGQSELVEAILGLRPLRSGRITATDRYRAALPDDRLRHALIADLSVRDNLLIRAGRQAPYRRALGWLDLEAWTRRARDLVRAFDVRTPTVHLRAGQLSGGNQQKVVVARELAEPVDLVCAMNPTRGLDVAASRAVFDRLLQARNAGAAVLLVHSDLDEVLALADEVSVLFEGRLTPTAWPTCSREEIGRKMLGLDGAAA